MPTLAELQAEADANKPFVPTPFQPFEHVDFPATPVPTTTPATTTPSPVAPSTPTIGQASTPGAGYAAQEAALAEQRNIAAGSVTRTDTATAEALAAQKAAAEKQDALYQAALATNKPASELGNLSIAQLQDMINNPAKFDATAVQDEAGYKFAQDQGQKAVTRTAQATGTLGNGGQYARATRQAVDIASTKYNEAFNRLMAVQQQREGLLKSGATIGQNANAASQNAGLALGTQLQNNTDSQSNVITSGAQQNNATMGQLSTEVGQGAQMATQLDIANLDVASRAKLAQMGIDSNEKLAAAGITSQEKLTQMGLTNQWNIANLDATTRTNLANLGINSNEKLAAMGITSAEKLAEYQRQNQWNIANLDATTRTTLAQMGIDSNEKLSKLDSDLRTKLTQMGIDANLVLGKLDAESRLQIAGIQSKAGNPGLVAATGIVSSLINNPTVLKGAISTIGKALGVGGPAAIAADLSAPIAADAFVGPTLAGAIAPSGSMGSALLSFATNPATLGVGAAIAIGISWLKSQAHWEANTYVKDFQNPYFETFAKPAHDEFFKAASEGTLTKESAQSALSAMESAWAGFKEKSDGWAGSSSDKKTVTDQAYRNSTGVFYTTNENIIKNMRAVVTAMG